MKLERENVALVVVDVQEKLLPVIDKHECITENLKKVIEGVQVLNIPVLLTAQYPKGLGPTVSQLKEVLQDYAPVEKISFSCCGESKFISALGNLNREQILVGGIEAHVCVYQTCLDLISKGYEVHLLTDCISSRNAENRTLAIDKLKSLGVSVTSVEMALFELLKAADSEEFKKISKIVK